MEKTFFISGIGGQGVQVLCKALATGVDECGMNMCLFPWYQGQRHHFRRTCWGTGKAPL